MDHCLASAQPRRAYLECVTQSVTPSAQGAVQRAVQRAGWLAELATALDQASRLTVALFDHKGDSRDATILREQIRLLRSEVDSMQRRRQHGSEQHHPDWMNFFRSDYTPGDRSPPPPNSAR